MADSLKELLDKASLLDPEARFDLVERLIDVDAPSTSDWNAAWSQEANNRLADFRAGSEPAFDADDVLLEGRRRIALRRNT